MKTLCPMLLLCILALSFAHASNYKEVREQNEPAAVGKTYELRDTQHRKFSNFKSEPKDSAKSFSWPKNERFQVIEYIPKPGTSSDSQAYYKIRFESGPTAYIGALDLRIEVKRLKGIAEAIRPMPATASDNQKSADEKGGLVTYSWYKRGGAVAIIEKITIRNTQGTPCRDIKGIMDFFAKSGTKLGSNAFTIYDVVPPRSVKTFKNINVGFVHSQTSESRVQIFNCQ